jgi:hypothetical protein
MAPYAAFASNAESLAGVPAATTTAATASGKGVFAATIMARVAYVTLPVSPLIGVEMVERRLSATRHRSTVTVMRIISIVDVTVEAVRAVKPGASSNKYPAGKPVGTVVAVGSAVIRRIVEVPVGAHRLDSDVDGDLSGRNGYTA